MHALHLFDDSADWEQRVAVHQLRDRLSRDGLTQFLASTDLRTPPDDGLNRTAIDRTPIRMNVPFTAAPALRKLIDRRKVDVVHAWGVRAAIAAAAAGPPHVSLVVQRFNPRLTPTEAKSLRTLADAPRFAVACAAGTVRRRLIENGLPPSVCVVIRPGVDFGWINAARRNTDLRRALQLDPHDRLAVTAHPLSGVDGLDDIVRAGFIVQHLDPARRTIVYGDALACRRLRRLSRFMTRQRAIIWATQRCRYEDIVAIADALIITPHEDVSTTSVAWAMAAGVPVIGSAVYAVSELIAHKHNGFLIKPEPGPAMSVKIAAAVDQTESMAKQTEVARGQAFEVFSIRRFVDQNLQLYENLAAGLPPAQAITDSAAAS